MTAHNADAMDVVQSLHSDLTTGLTERQIQEKRARHGENKLREKKRKTNFQRFVEQFKDVMILILIAAAIISFVIACVEGEPKEFFEPILILLIVVLNAVMGVMQESKAEKALDALKNMSAPHARVVRDGTEQVIEASELGPGDIIHLEAGDFVPADARLIHSVSIKSEESALTGESVPVEKNAEEVVEENAPLGERSNMVFSGCSITYGTASAVVTATGMDTEMGKIADLLNSEEEGQTPLQQKLAQLGTYLGIMALAACGVIFVVGILNGTTNYILDSMTRMNLGYDEALKQAGIQLYAGVQGDADAAVNALLAGELTFSEGATCDHHHDHGEGHSCGEHTCGGHCH